MKLTFIFAILLCGTAWAGNPDPNVINTTGGMLKNSNLVVDFSVGEISINTLSGTNSILTQGFLQPIKNITTSLANEKTETLISIYPNPVQDQLFFSIGTEIVKRATVYAMDGRKIITFEKPTVSLNFDCLTTGAYQVEFIGSKNQLLSSTKIVKQ